jgi:multiple sugar transport system substrate-binding protein
MLASINRLDAIAEAGDLNWDMASYPTYQEAPGKGINYDLHVMAITANSTNKEAAALVLSVITSDESQKLIEQSGRISVLKDASIHKLFGQNLPFLKNKNVDAIFKVTPAANFAPTEFDGLATGVLNDKISIAVFKDNLDVNSALRQAEEEINKLIDQSKK